MVDVLDTAALLQWPVERIVSGLCAESQQEELRRLSEPRYLLVQANPPQFSQPDPKQLQRAREAAARSGELSALSPVDLDVLALAIEHEAVLHSDDYRLQNIARREGIVARPVNTKGITSIWKWQLRCTGCRATREARSKDEDVPDCDICGSPMQLKRSRGQA